MLVPCRNCSWFQPREADFCTDCGVGTPWRRLVEQRQHELGEIEKVRARAGVGLPKLRDTGVLVFLAAVGLALASLSTFDLDVGGCFTVLGVAFVGLVVLYVLLSWWVAQRRTVAADLLVDRWSALRKLLAPQADCLRSLEERLAEEAKATLDRLEVTRDALLKNEKISDEDREAVGEARRKLIQRVVEELGTKQEQHALRLYVDASRWANGLERFHRPPGGDRKAREAVLHFLDEVGHEGDDLLQRVDRTLWPGYWSEGSMAIQSLVSRIRRIEQHLLKEGVNEVLSQGPSTDPGSGDHRPVFDLADDVEPLGASPIPRPGGVKVSVVVESLVEQAAAADGEARTRLELAPHGWQGQLGYYLGLPGFTV